MSIRQIPRPMSGVQSFFFDPFVEPAEFEPTFQERTGRTLVNAGIELIPFAGGQELLTLHGRHTRVDRLRVVFDRETLRATHKALRLVSGSYQQETLAEQILLRDN